MFTQNNLIMIIGSAKQSSNDDLTINRYFHK
jgi:hypothetical protein